MTETRPAAARPSDPGAAVDAITEELIGRLRPVLGDMPESEFLDLVRAMARRRERWERTARTHGP
jgi:hypothetical protein